MIRELILFSFFLFVSIQAQTEQQYYIYNIVTFDGS